MADDTKTTTTQEDADAEIVEEAKDNIHEEEEHSTIMNKTTDGQNRLMNRNKTMTLMADSTKMTTAKEDADAAIFKESKEKNTS